MAGKVIIYGDMMSQPSRSVWLFCKAANIPHKFQTVQIAKLEHITPEHAKRHPFKKVPVIEDNNVYIFESHAILRYLADKYNVEDHWYPKDLVQRAKVNEYLDWHHSNLRFGASRTAFMNFLGPRMGLKEFPKELKEDAAKGLKSALNSFEKYWLGNTKYISLNEISIADLSAYCELKQLDVVKYDFSAFPNISEWMKRMELLPGCADINLVINKVAANL